MKTYRIVQTDQPVPADGRALGPWARAEAAAICEFPWYRGGLRQGTTVRMLYDQSALHMLFTAADRHISAGVTELNGPVCTDSCVELFAAVEPKVGPEYFNLELNCCGVLHMGWGSQRDSRRLICEDLAGRIEVSGSEQGPMPREPRDDDEGWHLVVKLPWDVLDAFVGREIRPRPATVWRGNFYRCGGQVEPQFACWNPIDTDGPDYHRPECFAELHFA